MVSGGPDVAHVHTPKFTGFTNLPSTGYIQLTDAWGECMGSSVSYRRLKPIGFLANATAQLATSVQK